MTRESVPSNAGTQLLNSFLAEYDFQVEYFSQTPEVPKERSPWVQFAADFRTPPIRHRFASPFQHRPPMDRKSSKSGHGSLSLTPRRPTRRATSWAPRSSQRSSEGCRSMCLRQKGAIWAPAFWGLRLLGDDAGWGLRGFIRQQIRSFQVSIVQRNGMRMSSWDVYRPTLKAFQNV